MSAPTKIQFHRQSQELSLGFADGTSGRLSAEFLRVHSPSAEVKGHGPDQAVLQVGKREVNINALSQAGNYALKIEFDDGHDSGLYTWEYLATLVRDQTRLWQTYLDKLDAAGASRDKDVSRVRFV